MVIQSPPMSVEAFDEFVELPENSNRLFEYIAGRAVEVPSNPLSSKIAGIIFGEIYIWLKSNDIGHLTGENGGYIVNGQRYAPDVAFISYEKQRYLAEKGYNPRSPELAVEVISDSDNAQEQEDLRIKISHYLKAGTVVWVFNWKKIMVELHQPNEPVQILGENDVLDGGDILKGFTLKISDLFKGIR